MCGFESGPGEKLKQAALELAILLCLEYPDSEEQANAEDDLINAARLYREYRNNQQREG